MDHPTLLIGLLIYHVLHLSPGRRATSPSAHWRLPIRDMLKTAQALMFIVLGVGGFPRETATARTHHQQQSVEKNM